MSDEQLADLLPEIVALAGRADKAIMEVYAGDDFGETAKADNTPLTKADLASHRIITEALGQLTLAFPVLSEESPAMSYET
ncbi:MAG TPA: 3'(2'),5'-bisphosphate nucleotidase CysQ, partial [Nitrospirales bacterium]|nr:3'(2'),5'-bisphosphate nucleotidase CysQ [Nitrospirales bacterium]